VRFDSVEWTVGIHIELHGAALIGVQGLLSICIGSALLKGIMSIALMEYQ
jgi:hypothetical protein